MISVPTARHLLRAKDLVDARYREPLDVPTLARAAHVSPAHFSREFRRAFGETPHQYLLTRRMERAAALLRTTDRSVAEICIAVGLRSVGVGYSRPAAACHPRTLRVDGLVLRASLRMHVWLGSNWLVPPSGDALLRDWAAARRPRPLRLLRRHLHSKLRTVRCWRSALPAARTILVWSAWAFCPVVRCGTHSLSPGWSAMGTSWL